MTPGSIACARGRAGTSATTAAMAAETGRRRVICGKPVEETLKGCARPVDRQLFLTQRRRNWRLRPLQVQLRNLLRLRGPCRSLESVLREPGSLPKNHQRSALHD